MIDLESIKEQLGAWQAGRDYATHKEEISQIKEEIRELALLPVRNDTIRRIGREAIRRFNVVYGQMQELLEVPYTDELKATFREGAEC